MKNIAYKATVHTLEIEPHLPEGMKPEEWRRQVYEVNHPCVDRTEKVRNSYCMIVNPHKLYQGDDGRFTFDYRSLDTILQDMESIGNDLGMTGFTLKRADICLDTTAPYTQTRKLTRLIMLMLADAYDLPNRYESRDPLTLEVKSAVMMNGKKYNSSLEIEHYNRALLDQESWTNAPVVNRFELRAMREQATGIMEAAQNWQKRLAGLTAEHLKHVTDGMTNSLFALWEDYASRLKRPTSTHWNHFLATHAESICTRDQLLRLCQRYDASVCEAPATSDRRIDNLMMKARFGNCFELFTFKDVQAVIEQMRNALTDFIGEVIGEPDEAPDEASDGAEKQPSEEGKNAL